MNSQRSYNYILLEIIAFICLLCTGCSSLSSDTVQFETDVKNKNISNTITAYFSAAEKSQLTDIMDILYFKDENQFEQWAYEENLEAGIHPIFATVYSVDKINDSLYAITLDVEMSNEKESPNGIVYNFVALIDNNWRYILAQQNIPDDVLNNADLSAYSYSNDSILPNDTIISIQGISS